MASTTLPPPANLPLPPPPGGGGGPPPPLSKTILLHNLPTFLCDKNRLRSWLGEVTAIRQVHLVAATSSSNNNNNSNNTTTMETTTTNEEDEKKQNESVSSSSSSRPSSSLVTLTHPDGAVKLIIAIRYVRQQLLEAAASRKQTDAKIIAAHWVPAQPHVPMPPPALDPTVGETLGKRMWASYQRLEGGQTLDPRALPLSATEEHNNNNVNTTTTTTTDNAEDMDDTEDPLTSPAVLQAVREFRARLEKQQGSKAVRRKELVQASLDRILPRVRQDMARAPAANLPPPPPPPGNLPPPPPPPAGGNLPPPPPPPAGNLPPPPLPTHLPPPPMPTNLPPPPPPANLPPPPMPTGGPPPPDDEPPAKRAKTTTLVPLDVTQPFPVFSQLDAVRAYCRQQISSYVGEADDALVDFIMQHISNPTLKVESYMAELQEVLEEDAPKFMQELLNHVQSLQ